MTNMRGSVLLSLIIAVCFLLFSCSKKSSKHSQQDNQENLQPACWVYPAVLDFDTVTMGEYADTTFFVVNIGGGTLTGDINESCGDFKVLAGGGTYSLITDQIRSVTVRFEPTSGGSTACHVETGSDLCEDVLCIGVGEPAPACSVYPSNIDFGRVKLGENVDTTFRIVNIGDTVLEGKVEKPGLPHFPDCEYFFFVSGHGYYSLTPGESRIVTIRFAPVFLSYVTCNISLANDACSSVYCIGGGRVD